MANNSELLTQGFRITLKTLVPYVVSELKSQYEDEWWTKGVYAIIYDDHKQDYPEKTSDEDAIARMDVLLTLKTIDQNWGYFKKKLPREYKSWVNEALAARNKWAHQSDEEFTDSKTARALETMSLLCQPINVEAEAELQTLVRTARYGNEKGSVAATPKKVIVKVKRPVSVSTPQYGNLKSWRDVIWPHVDVSEGRYKKAEFAADLSQVINGKASSEYRDPVEFFNRTYITTGMSNLLTQALERISGKGGEPVVQLKTAFGGGKTHTMLALYHMFGGRVSPENIPALKPLTDKVGLATIPKANIAVLVGTALSKSTSRRPADMPGITINTLWGEMAYQLAKAAGDPSLYDIVKEADKKGVNPGSAALTELFDKSGSTLILLDELVAYGRELYDKTNLPAGTYASFISFIQSLTEAADGSPRCMVVASIPESDMEVGGEYGQKTLEEISHHFGRKETIWKPVEASEGFEVVRRRLFMECQDIGARDAVCEAFFKMYQDNPQDFPVECRQLDYLERMKQCYPIHPEVFDRLYDDWATLEKFQRTRGVLRLMAAVINNLWENGNADLLILPSSIPVCAPFVKEELLRYLDDSWNAIVDNEIDGKKSTPFKIDSKDPRFGVVHACVKVTRTLFFGSAPSSGTNNRGIALNQMMLGCTEPGDKLFTYSDALNRLVSTLSYLYSGYGNYWFDTRPTLRKMMEEKASRVSDDEANDLIRSFTKQTPKGRVFKTVHICPSQSLDIPDEQESRLVILDHLCCYTTEESDDNEVRRKINDILSTRGSSPRIYKNMLVFCFADRKSVNSLIPDAKKYIAWKQIDKDKDDLELSNADKRTIADNLTSSKSNLTTKIISAYSWVCDPRVSTSNPKEFELTFEQLSTTDNIVASCESKFLQSEAIVNKFSAMRLSIDLQNYIWKNSNHVEIKELWKYYTSYCYLTRLMNFRVLEDAIMEALRSHAYFAIADGIAPDGKYVNLRWDADSISIDSSSFLVSKFVAETILKDKETSETVVVESESMSAEEIVTSVPIQSPFSPFSTGGSSTASGGSKPTTKYKSFYLTKDINIVRFSRDVQRIYDEVIDKLQSVPNARVKVSLEVHADFDSNSVDVNTKRSVEENCTALGIDDFGFDE